MTIWFLILAVFVLGAIGGFLNSLATGELRLPKVQNGIWNPGWIGNVLIGGVAAVVTWCMYGPLAQTNILSASDSELGISLSQLVVSVIIGLGGANTLESQLKMIKLEINKP